MRQDNHSGSLHCSFCLDSCSSPQRNGSYQLTTHYLFLAMAWHSCFRERHETRVLQKVVHTPARTEMSQDSPSPVCNFYAKSTDDRHHQTQCLYFLQDSSQGRQSKQDFLWVLVWLNINIYFFTYIFVQRRCSWSLFQHICDSAATARSHASLLAGCSHGCVQHDACSRLSPDQSSRDNQVR